MSVMQVRNAENMAEVAQAVLEIAAAKQTDQATVIALTGDLGAGKTTFTQQLANALGVTETVTSPTFVVMKHYELAEGSAKAAPSFSRLTHIDAYRIEDIDEMRVLGFAELLQEKDTIICIEWPERIAELIPDDAIKVEIAIDGESRTVTIC